MRKLDYNEYKICQILAQVFEKSVDLSNLSSPMFIKRFMNYEGSKCYFDKSYLILSSNIEDIIYELNEKYHNSGNKILYTKQEMYWIGYVSGALSFLYEISAKTVNKLFPATQIVKYYNIYHTFDVEEAAERMMDNIGYVKEDYTTKGVRIMRQLILEERSKKYNSKKK